jgi:hypothetical protein
MEGGSLFEMKEPGAVGTRKRQARIATRVVRVARLHIGCTAEVRVQVPDRLLAGMDRRRCWHMRPEVSGEIVSDYTEDLLHEGHSPTPVY